MVWCRISDNPLCKARMTQFSDVYGTLGGDGLIRLCTHSSNTYLTFHQHKDTHYGNILWEIDTQLYVHIQDNINVQLGLETSAKVSMNRCPESHQVTRILTKNMIYYYVVSNWLSPYSEGSLITNIRMKQTG